MGNLRVTFFYQISEMVYVIPNIAGHMALPVTKSLQISKGGCFSSFGRLGKRQQLNLGRGCVIRHNVIHEFNHVIGFLHEQGRPGRTASKEEMEVGALVVIKEENLSPIKWSLGRIVEVHPGSDNVVRVVTVKTSSGIYKRPVAKLCVLPVQ